MPRKRWATIRTVRLPGPLANALPKPLAVSRKRADYLLHRMGPNWYDVLRRSVDAVVEERSRERKRQHGGGTHPECE